MKISSYRTLYLSVHDDERPAEIFLRLEGCDCSSELIGLYDVIARLMSLALQYGAPGSRRLAIYPQAPNVVYVARYSNTFGVSFEDGGVHGGGNAKRDVLEHTRRKVEVTFEDAEPGPMQNGSGRP